MRRHVRTRPGGRALGVLLAAALVAGGPLTTAGPAYAADAAAYQDRLNSALQKMVDAVVGPGHAVVTTTAELDDDQVETVRTRYTQDPSAGALTERLSSSSGQNGSARYQSTSSERTAALDVVTETRRDAPGDVTKLDVAVVVDANAAANIDLAQLRTLVGTAAGIDPARGDVVTVAALPFHTEPAPAAATTTPVAGGDSRPLMLAGGVFGLLALVLAGLVLLGRGRRRRQREQDQLAAERAHRLRMLAALDAEPERPILAEAVVGAPLAESAAERAEGVAERAERREAIGRLVAEDPARAAAVLRGLVGS
jgi:flagellar M-ring protein FliF